MQDDTMTKDAGDACASSLLDALQATTMLAVLRTPAFGVRRRDKEASAEISSQAGAVSNAALVSVNLLAGADNIHQEITRLQRQARNAFNHITTTWDYEGWRLLPSVLFDRCLAEVLQAHKPRMEELKERLRQEAPDIIRRAQEGLGDFAHRHKLPTAEEMAESYDLRVEFQSVPDGMRFRKLPLPEKTIETLTRHVERRAQAKAQEAMAEPLERLAAVLETMLDRLKVYGEREMARARGEQVGKTGTFKESLATNVKEIAELLPAFNLTHDPAFQDIADRAIALANGIDADSLRKSRHVRETATHLGTSLLDAIRAISPGSK